MLQPNQTHSAIIVNRTRSIYKGQTAMLHTEAYGKDKRLWPAPKNRIQLPWSLEFFQLQVAEAIEENALCPYCGDYLHLGDFSLDHIIPVSRRMEFASTLEHYAGGATDNYSVRLTLCAFAWDNLALSHFDCNMRKGVLTKADWELLRTAMGLMSDIGKRYLWKQLVLSDDAFRRRLKAKK